MPLVENLREMERAREAYWLGSPGTAPVKLRWRALTVRHCFHVLPGESILEIGGGSGLWTRHLSSVFRGENPITVAVFHDDFAETLTAEKLPNTEVVKVSDFEDDLGRQTFDYIIGTAILCHNEYPQNLKVLRRLLKPGGQILFFEANYWNLQVFLKNTIPFIARLSGQARCQLGMRKFKLMQAASHQGYTHIEIIPYDIVHSRTPPKLIPFLQSLAFILEHAPVIRNLCGTLYIWAKKPSVIDDERPFVNLANHQSLYDSTSVVIPAHNEEVNIPPLVNALLQTYDAYIHEIIIVNDNSSDETDRVVRQLAESEPRIKLLNRIPPKGVGRALRDGYAAASGRYILTLDCDFVLIVPELRDLFDVIAEGADGAIGSRFSHESMLVNYPFFKVICNRAFHLLVNLALPTKVRDISNNLKLYRTEILKNLEIRENHFAANAETGLGPLLKEYDIREVPMSWINRTIDMGSSSFNIVRVAPNYFWALLRIIWQTWKAKSTTKAEHLTLRKEGAALQTSASAVTQVKEGDQ